MIRTILTFGLSALAALAQSLPNATPLPNSNLQFFASDGTMLVGGKVCSYVSGTSTPLATYTDSTAGTPNSNPVTLDSAGRASIWLGPKLYRIVVRTAGTPNSCSDGTVISSQDGVTDVALYFVNFVKTIGTASAITTAQTPSGSITRTQLSKNNDILSVKDFGAVGDGSTDDTAAINAAVAVSTIGTISTTGVCIYFPDGIYKITSEISANHTICLTGNSWRLKYTAGGTITAILAIIGDPVNTYGTHGTFLEGSIVNGAILDGGGHATYGFILQGVIQVINEHGLNSLNRFVRKILLRQTAL